MGGGIPISSAARSFRLSRSMALGILGVCLAATLLRIAAARGELWFDEVWSLRLVAENVRSPADIVLTLKHDNNHFLNSLLIYFVGPDGSPWMYRWPAVLAGSLAVLLAGWIQRRRGFITALSAVVLTGFSFVLVNYSSEARGYAYQIFFSMLAFGILCEADESPSAGWDCLFCAACVLGFLSHPMFLVVYLASQAWTWFPFGRAPTDKPALTLLLRTILPGLFFAWLYFVNIRQMKIGGGSIRPHFDVVVQTLSLAIGGPFSAPGVYIAAVVTVLLALAALWFAFRQSLRRGSFYLTVIAILPAILLAIGPREDLYPRYFLVNVLFLLMLWSDFMGEVGRRLTYGKLWVTLALVTFTCANGWRLAELIHLQRSHYQEALDTMDQQTRGEEILALVDHLDRQNMMLDFYSRRVGLHKPIKVATPSAESLKAAEWFLLQSPNIAFSPPPEFESFGVKFGLVAHYPFSGLSGWQLCLYHREN